jgi:2-polyprenyl-3-methyl-5-hydroxy-6-metoxy-1,4-benzoquinol methylase
MNTKKTKTDDATQTRQSFLDKWSNSNTYQIGGSKAFDSDTLQWILVRNGCEDLEGLRSKLKNSNRILDAGCGNGRILNLLRELVSPEVAIVGVDLVASNIARENITNAKNVSVNQGDLTDADSLVDLGMFDFIYCQEVLHHTSNPQVAFKNLIKLLLPGGEIAIYVYKQKAPIREHTDDYVRGLISELSHDKAMKFMRQFSDLGQALAELELNVTVPEVELLGIEPGSYDIQRFIYHFFLKCYWNPELSLQDNAMINYDWYHPSICSRHTSEEVYSWFEDNELKITHTFVDHYGITVHGKKN